MDVRFLSSSRPSPPAVNLDNGKIIHGDLLLKAFYNLYFIDRPAQEVLIGALEQKGIVMDDKHSYPFYVIENALSQMFGKAAAPLFVERLKKTLSSLMLFSELTASDS